MGPGRFSVTKETRRGAELGGLWHSDVAIFPTPSSAAGLVGLPGTLDWRTGVVDLLEALGGAHPGQKKTEAGNKQLAGGTLRVTACSPVLCTCGQGITCGNWFCSVLPLCGS